MINLAWIYLMVADVKVVGLYRYAVKGLGHDVLESVTIRNSGETFPDDRRYALLKATNRHKFDPAAPGWLHKENFLCAFSDPELMAKYRVEYRILGSKDESFATPFDATDMEGPRRLLTIKSRGSDKTLLGPTDLEIEKGREELGNFFSLESGEKVVCVTTNCNTHVHQFGNTASGVKARQDTRTVHIVNAATVRELSDTIRESLNPTRFRPNIVLDGLEPWEEFKWVGNDITCGTMKLSVLKRTIRCVGVSVDPCDPSNKLDIPGLLAEHYPQYGPYFGIYAAIVQSGSVKMGDTVDNVQG